MSRTHLLAAVGAAALSLPVAAAAASPRFVGTVAPVTAAQLRYSYRPGCPVGPAQLRLLHMSYIGFDGAAHVGAMVVNAAVVHDVLTVFRQLYAERFPIRRMEPVDAFHGSDNASMAADNTSGFNCRYAVTTGPKVWSVHAYGEAIDVNTVENPYREGGSILPPAGAAYADRADVRPGMAVPGGELVKAFASVGWFWGGRWTASPDYQHFSKTGG
jgi:D-alanyl-D-alanine carboxypeptidase-like protein